MEPSKVFADRITSLLQGGEQWSDLTIENQDESTFNVHRVIFCSQSKVIDRIVRNQNPNPAEKFCIYLVMNPDVLEELVCYFYTGDYLKQPSTISLTAEHTVWSHFSIYSAAHEYEIDALKELSRNRLLDWVSVNTLSSAYSEVINDLIELSPDDTYMEQVLAKIFSESVVSLVHHLHSDCDLMQSSGFLRKVLVEVASDRKRLKKKLHEANGKIETLESTLVPKV